MEQYEMEHLEKFIARLRQDGDAIFPPPAAEKDIAECNDFLKRTALPHPLSPDFIAFLAVSNGFAWNGIEIFGADPVSGGAPHGYKVQDIIGMNLDFLRMGIDFACGDGSRIPFGAGCGLLYFGRADEDLYMYNEQTEKYEVRDRTDREVYDEYDRFAAFFIKEVGRRLGEEEPLDDIGQYDAWD
ncbi:hypothetical protein AGMMS49587_05430 [Spirochaetia bacterium]|nr:hypothetical protein AGMMS49587_05430 [Spirochaetia bacterium]